MEKPGYVSEYQERIEASTPSVGIAYKAARFTLRTVLYSTVFAAATYLGLSVARVPIEARVGTMSIDNKKLISSIDSILGNDSQRKPSTVEPGPNY